MKNIALTTLVAIFTASTLPAIAHTTSLSTSQNSTASASEPAFSNAELDGVLAPIALYPDTLLTHILIAATYPLDVVSADRWRQSNQHLTPEQVELVLEDVAWDPSVKALAPFTDLLHTMAEDLTWLQQVGDSVLVNQARVLERVQVLRQHARNTGNLLTNDYIEVETERDDDREIIYIAPRQREIVYIPYYNPLVVYGHWWHPINPTFWGHRVSYHYHHNVYWAPRVRLSTSFYFGGVHWHNRHVVIHREPVRRYYHGSPRKRVVSHGYQRWEHRIDHRQARYSSRVVHSSPTRFKHSTVIRNKGQQKVVKVKGPHKSLKGIERVRHKTPPNAAVSLRKSASQSVKNANGINKKQSIERALKANKTVKKQPRPKTEVVKRTERSLNPTNKTLARKNVPSQPKQSVKNNAPRNAYKSGETKQRTKQYAKNSYNKQAARKAPNRTQHKH